MNEHYLSALIFLPATMAGVQIFIFSIFLKSKGSFFRWGSLLASIIFGILAATLIFSSVPRGDGFLYKESLDWIGSFNIRYDVGLDGLNSPILLLGSIFFPVIILSEWSHPAQSKGYHCIFLLLQTGFTGMILSLDLFLMLFFVSLTLLPIFFLIAIYGGNEKSLVSMRYLLSGVIGISLFLFGILLVYYSNEPHSLSLVELNGKGLSGQVPVAFWIITVSFAFLIPIFPFHSWFTLLAGQAPIVVLTILSGIGLPSAANVLIRIHYQLFPELIQKYSGGLMVLFSLTIFFSFICSIGQKNVLKFLSYTVMGLFGTALLGGASLSSSGISGAIYLQLSSGLALTAFGLFASLIVKKIGEAGIEFGSESESAEISVSEKMPVLAISVALMGVAILGFPGFGTFVGNSLVTMGVYSVGMPFVLVIVLSQLLFTFGFFGLFQKIFIRSRTSLLRAESDLLGIEKIYIFPVLIFLLVIGLYPKPILDLIRPAVEGLLGF